jgi:signal transduction histidine kinase
MHRAAERMNHLIRDLLDVARIEGGRLTVEIGRQDAAQIVMEISDLLRPLAHERGIALVGRTEESLPPVACDRERTLQVLSNFIGNALKFTPAGGQITVTAEQDVAGVRFSVRDTGTGIQRADQARIFDRFWQGDRAGRDGAGLGLAISKGIVEAHGGRIGVESEPGAGATFWFTLRVAASSGGHEGSRANGA